MTYKDDDILKTVNAIFETYDTDQKESLDESTMVNILNDLINYMKQPDK